MFERFTETARQSVILAQEEARLVNSEAIGTEHLVLGLLRSEGMATRALGALGFETEMVRADVVLRFGIGEEKPSQRIPFTPSSKKVLELALREALALGHNYIGTEHVLLGLVRYGERGEIRGWEVLSKSGLPSQVVREEVLALMDFDVARYAKSQAPSLADLAEAIRFSICWMAPGIKVIPSGDRFFVSLPRETDQEVVSFVERFFLRRKWSVVADSYLDGIWLS